MSEHWNGGNGGKGSKPRPFNISDSEYEENLKRIFGDKTEEKERKAREKAEYFAKLNAETNKKLGKEEFELESLDPDERSWYYDDHGIKRRKEV